VKLIAFSSFGIQVHFLTLNEKECPEQSISYNIAKGKKCIKKGDEQKVYKNVCPQIPKSLHIQNYSMCYYTLNK
jgi:hypothetical protein